MSMMNGSFEAKQAIHGRTYQNRNQARLLCAKFRI
jgi:hypothetical protein